MMSLCVRVCISQKSSCRHVFHRRLLGLSDHPLAFPATLVTEPGSTCADPRSGSLFGRMAEQSPSSLSVLVCFIKSRYGSPCSSKSMGSPFVAVGLLAHTLFEEDAFRSSGADGFTKKKSFLACYNSSVCQAAGKNRGKAFQMNSEQ